MLPKGKRTEELSNRYPARDFSGQLVNRRHTMKRKDHQFLAAVKIVFWGILIAVSVTAKIVAAGELSAGQSVYVPIYSHIYSGDREHPFLLAAILSIRNIDPQHNITVIVVDYYDSDGNLLRKYLEQPVKLAPLASKRYVVGESDKSGGSGAKFIVKWKSPTKVNPPIVESVMIGTKMQQGISFVSRGQPLLENGPKQ